MVRRRTHIQPRSGPERAFGEVLRQLRRSQRLSQEALGDRCGSERTFISLLERGLVSPTLRTIVKVTRALGLSPTEMLRRTERSSFYRR
jgi:transcriptional regulator with XRE-family HTH domain